MAKWRVGNDSSMHFGMRWWLALAFAAVAATTAVALAQVSSSRSEAEFRERAEQLAVGSTFEAAIELRDEPIDRVAQRRRIALFLVEAQGRLVSATRSHGIEFTALPGVRQPIAEALEGRRVVRTDESVRATLVVLPNAPGARVLVAYVSHPDLAAELGIVNDEITRAAWLALVPGGIVGVMIASLIARRLKRIARATAAMEKGDLETPLARDFPDEVGDLALTFDRMRERLRASFRQLESDRDRLGRLLERLHEGVVAVDRELNVQFANRVARRLVGTLEPGDPLPEPWEPFFSMRGFADELFAADGVTERRVELGDDRVVALSGVPASPDDVAVVVIRDLTDEERRHRVEREFVANASHELRTPVTTILGAVEVLRDGGTDDPAVRDRFLTHIEREARKLVRLTRALLVLARAQNREESPRLTSVELLPLLERVAESMRARPGVETLVRCEPGVYAFADPDLLEQALVNVAANAVEHTRRGEIALAAASDGNGYVRIAVQDTGPGVPPALQERIFDRFYRPAASPSGGFGLGLAIAREAVEAQGGYVDLHSGEKGGTTVTIELRRADP